MSTSKPPTCGRSSRRTNSPSRRFTRFRATALCPNLGTTIPTRPRGTREARLRTSQCAVRMRFPSRAARWISPARTNRRARGKRARSGAGVLGWKLNGEALAPLLPTTAQDIAPPARRHARPIPMRADSALVAGTVSWLAHTYSTREIINEVRCNRLKVAPANGWVNTPHFRVT
jgi:hypothetical protein